MEVTYNAAGQDTIAGYLEETLGYRHNFRWAAVAISFGFVLVIRFIVATSTKYLNFQKR